MLEGHRQHARSCVLQPLATIFHLPTLMVMALLSVMLLWQLYDIGLEMGRQFVRLRSNQGNVTVHWIHGCCELDWP